MSLEQDIGARVAYAIERIGGPKRAAAVTGISTSSLDRYVRGMSDPTASRIARLSEASGVDIRWLVTGKGAPDSEADSIVAVPRYDVRLAPGGGAFRDRAKRLAEAPFASDYLRARLGANAPDDLALFEVSGDSMEPTISDRDLVMADLGQTELEDGVYAFMLGDHIRVKRLRRLVDGVQIISDNADLYPPEVLRDAPAALGERNEAFLSREEAQRFSPAQTADRLRIVGKIIWIGKVI